MFLWRRYFICVLLLLLSLIYSCLAGFKEYGSLTKKSFSFSAKNFLTVRNVLSVTSFCIRICRLEHRVSSFKLSLAFVIIIIIIMVLHRQSSAVILLLCCCCCCRRRLPLSQVSYLLYFSWTNGDPHRSGFKFQTAALSVLCVTFHVQLSFVGYLLNVCLVWFSDFSLKVLLLFRGLQLLPYNHTY